MRIFQRGYAFLTLLLLLCACHKENAYETALPEDAAVVVSVDVVSMAEKAGLYGREGEPVAARLGSMLKSEMQGAERLIDEIIKDPTESGMDLRRKVYFFVGSQTASAGVLISVKDKGKVDDFLSVLHSQQLCEEVYEDAGYSWTVAGKGLIAYSDDAFLVLTDPNGGEAAELKHTAALLLRQKVEDSFSATDSFRRMTDERGDVVVFSSLDFLSGEYVSPLLMGISGELNLRDVKALATVRFEQGKTVIDIENLTTDRIVLDGQKRLGQIMRPIKSTYLDMFPANTFCWLSLNVDGGNLYDWLCENPLLKQQFENSMMPLDFESIFRSIKGDMALTFPQPDSDAFIAYADVTDSHFLRAFEDLKPLLALTGGRMRLVDKGTSAYEFRITDGTMFGLGRGAAGFWFGVKDDRLYITNREGLVDAWIPGLKLRDVAWAGSVPGKRFFLGMNALPVNSLGKEMSVLSGGMEYLTLVAVDENRLSIELTMKEKNLNMLSYLLRMLR